MVKLRLQRQGAKKNPEYLIVAIDSTSKRDGEILQKIGHYYPKAKAEKDKVKINPELLTRWTTRGAQPTETVRQLLKTVSR